MNRDQNPVQRPPEDEEDAEAAVTPRPQDPPPQHAAEPQVLPMDELPANDGTFDIDIL